MKLVAMRKSRAKTVSLFLATTLVVLALAPTASAQVPPGEKILIEMSDGVKLSGQFVLPEGKGPFPVLLNMTPYGPGTYYFGYYAAEGYAHVDVDVRGSGDSGGALCIFCKREQEDVYEVVEWVADQDWSNGKVGMFGTSYQGITPLMGAGLQPPHLEAIVPDVSFADPYRDIVWHNGMYNYNFIAQWFGLQTALSMSGTGPNIDPVARAGQTFATETYNHPYDDEWYRERSVSTYHDKIKVPTLHTGGWFDGFSRGTIRNFQGIAAKHNRLIMRPCTHKGCLGANVAWDPASEYAADAIAPGYDDVVLAWMDHFLKGTENGIDKDSPVLYYDIGAHKWERANTWPPEDTRLQRLYLSGATSGSSESLNDGSLLAKPTADNGTNELPHDPMVGIAETFAKWGTVAASPHVRLDHRIDETRSLTYTTPELTEPLTLAGPLELNFWGATTGSDADWVIKVTDVAPDGTSTLVTSGYVRSSHRQWDEKRSKPGVPWLPNTKSIEVPAGEPMEHRVDVWDIAHTVLKGHRLRVIVMPSDGPNHMPLWERAVNTMFYGPMYPGQLILTTR